MPSLSHTSTDFPVNPLLKMKSLIKSLNRINNKNNHNKLCRQNTAKSTSIHAFFKQYSTESDQNYYIKCVQMLQILDKAYKLSDP